MSVSQEHRVQTAGESESRLSAALEEYYTALDAGHPPDRAAFLAEHADVAEQLAGCLDSLEFVRAVAPQLGEEAGAGAIRPLAILGDFRIVREIGRGGMGVVYEAEQLSLGRSVALKVLPFAAMLDKRQLQRFKNEASAAAALDHPHIVHVYGVGSDRGVHFYAMQLIEGMSLAEVIAEMQAEKSGKRKAESF